MTKRSLFRRSVAGVAGLALSLPLLVTPVAASTSAQSITSAPYPVNETAAKSLTPTFSVQVEAVGSQRPSVEFEVYNAEQTTRLANGTGAFDATGRANWTVPNGVFADTNEYAWRSRAVTGGQEGEWSELHPVAVDATDGVDLPAGPPKPGAVDGLVVTPAAGGAYLTWQAADGGPGAAVTHYVVRAQQTGSGSSPAVEVVVPAGQDHAVVTGLSSQFEYRYSVTAHNDWFPGPEAVSGAVRPATTPLPAAQFTAMATDYVKARGLLASGGATSPAQAVEPSPHREVIRAAVQADGPADLKQREHLVKQNLFVGSHTTNLSEIAVIPGQGGAVTVHADVYEKLDQEAVVSTAEKVQVPEERIRRFTFAFTVAGTAWKLTSASTPLEGEGQPDPVVETPDVKPVAMDKNGFAEGPQLMSTTAAVNHGRIAAYGRAWALKDNPHYKIKGNDCTNFISQALRHGYFPMKRGFYRNDGVWWYTGARPIYGSFTWYAAHNSFNHMWKKKRADFRSYFNQAVPGDILYFDFQGDGHLDHAAVVTNVKGNHIWYSQHSPKKKYRHLQDVLPGSPNLKLYIAHPKG
ncbi:amidase domain-containing protein [Crossiella sp. CA198]|uniref:amidase domain-containing protein n=1 Tax=Crossiella sp. CA198 TaxID=3455607 RepID=UPI003F8CF980